MTAKTLIKLLLFLSLSSAPFSVMHAEQQKFCALVLMHGKWSNPKDMGFFGDKLEPTCTYKSIEMPWSLRRSYDVPYLTALAEIKNQVDAFRAEGYKNVILVGHSFGANAALAYMAEIGDADAVISLAPGHSPAYMYQKGISSRSVDQARGLVAAGKGDETLTIDDLNQAQRRNISMRADVLLSYFDPVGLGNMPLTVTRFKKAVPLLWVVGNQDPLYPFGAGYAFDKAPQHTGSQYVVVQAGHVSTPDAAVGNVLEWLKNLQ